MVTTAASIPENQFLRTPHPSGLGLHPQKPLWERITAYKTALVPGTIVHSVVEIVMVGEPYSSFKTRGNRGCNSHQPQGVCSVSWSPKPSTPWRVTGFSPQVSLAVYLLTRRFHSASEFPVAPGPDLSLELQVHITLTIPTSQDQSQAHNC